MVDTCPDDVMSLQCLVAFVSLKFDQFANQSQLETVFHPSSLFLFPVLFLYRGYALCSFLFRDQKDAHRGNVAESDDVWVHHASHKEHGSCLWNALVAFPWAHCVSVRSHDDIHGTHYPIHLGSSISNGLSLSDPHHSSHRRPHGCDVC